MRSLISNTISAKAVCQPTRTVEWQYCKEPRIINRDAAGLREAVAMHCPLNKVYNYGRNYLLNKSMLLKKWFPWWWVTALWKKKLISFEIFCLVTKFQNEKFLKIHVFTIFNSFFQNVGGRANLVSSFYIFASYQQGQNLGQADKNYDNVGIFHSS